MSFELKFSDKFIKALQYFYLSFNSAIRSIENEVTGETVQFGHCLLRPYLQRIPLIRNF